MHTEDTFYNKLRESGLTVDATECELAAISSEVRKLKAAVTASLRVLDGLVPSWTPIGHDDVLGAIEDALQDRYGADDSILTAWTGVDDREADLIDYQRDCDRDNRLMGAA